MTAIVFHIPIREFIGFYSLNEEYQTNFVSLHSDYTDTLMIFLETFFSKEIWIEFQ